MADSERIGPYRVIRRLGAGGMGEVVLAHDDRLDRQVAIKRLHDDTATPERRERFRREARIVARLDHPAIVKIHDVHHEAGHDYLIMEYVEGQTLRARSTERPMTVSEALDIAHQIALGMAAAHDRGVIHRDLKAENVLITPAGRARLTDFGIAKLEGDDTFTADGAVIGTFRAMSPEQALGRPIDHRSDLFSFGILLHEALTGESPFRAETAFLTVQRLVRDDPRSLDELVPSIPDGLAKLVHQLLAKEPLLRPRDFHEVADALSELASQVRDAPCRAASHGGPPPAGDDTRSTEHSVAPTQPLPDRTAPTRSLPDAAAPGPPPPDAAAPDPPPDAVAMPDPGGVRGGSSERPAMLGPRDPVRAASTWTGPRGRWSLVVALGAGAVAALGVGSALRGGSRAIPPPARAAVIAPAVSSARDAPADHRDWRAVDLGTKAQMWGIWGSGPDDVYAVGEAMLHYDGAAWRSIHLPTTYRSDTVRLADVWGSGPNDVFAAGEEVGVTLDRYGAIWHYDGANWTRSISKLYEIVSSEISSIRMWGSGPDDVFCTIMLRSTDMMLHYDGTGWTPMHTGMHGVADIWGSGRGDVFAVGPSDQILHFDGARWQSMDSHVNPGPGIIGNLRAVWGSGSHDVFAVGDSGITVHYDGTGWQPVNSGAGTSETLWTVWGAGPHDVYVAGDAVRHYDGDSWRPVNLRIHSRIARVWGSSSEDVYVIKFDGTLMHHDGTDWLRTESGTTADIKDVWGDRPDNVYAVTGGSPGACNGAILHHDGVRWQPMSSGTQSCLSGIWGSGPRDLYAVGGGGTVVHHDGTGWQPMSSGTPVSLSGVWGTGPRDVYAVGVQGTILHYDGARWRSMESGTNKSLFRIWGSGPNDIYATGSETLHYDGTSWQPVKTFDGRSHLAVWGSGPDDVYVVGSDGMIVHYDGHHWITMDSGTIEWIHGVWGSNPNDVYAAGATGTLLHYDGHGWSALESGESAKLESIWGDVHGRTRIVGGAGGVIYRMSSPKQFIKR